MSTSERERKTPRTYGPARQRARLRYSTREKRCSSWTANAPHAFLFVEAPVGYIMVSQREVRLKPTLSFLDAGWFNAAALPNLVLLHLFNHPDWPRNKLKPSGLWSVWRVWRACMRSMKKPERHPRCRRLFHPAGFCPLLSWRGPVRCNVYPRVAQMASASYAR